MPHKTHLQKVGRFLAHESRQSGTPARLAALTLLLAVLLMLPVSLQAAGCELYVLDISAAPQTSDASQPPLEGWVDVSLPDYWQQRWPTEDTVWYRVNWQNTCGSSETTALALSHIAMAGEVHVNNTLLWRDTSQQEPFSRSWNMPRYWLLPEASLLEGDNTLWIRASGMPYDKLGLGELTIGDPVSVQATHQRRLWLQRHVFTLNLTMSLALGLLFIGIWLVRRSEAAFGWFALASLTWALIAGTMLAATPWPFSDSADWNRFVGTLFIGYCCTFCLFTWHFGLQSFPRLTRLLPTFTLLFAASLWMFPDAWLTPALIILIGGYSLLYLGNCIQFQHHAWRNRERHILLLALCLLVFLLVGLRDLLVVLTLMPGSILLAPFTSLAAMLFMFLIILDRLARGFRHVEDFNVELQTAVNVTYAELTQTLHRKHELEASNIRLTERLRLSHDLHDSLGGSLVRSIATVEQSGMKLDNNRFLSMLKELRDDLRQIIDNSSMAGRSDSETPAEWIASTRQRFVLLFDELGIRSHWEMPLMWPCSLTSMRRIELGRFIEEALSNAVKHSHCNSVEVAMHATEEGALVLRIIDDGIGFDVDAAYSEGGVGMRSMASRIKRIGGSLDIQSRTGETCLSVELKC